VKENLLLPRQVRPGRARSRPDIRAISQFAGNGSAARARKLSGGEQQMLAIGPHPGVPARRLSLLDEPPRGLAPVIIQQIGRTIGMLKAKVFRSCLSNRFSFRPLPSPIVIYGHGAWPHRGLTFCSAELKAKYGKAWSRVYHG